MLERRKRTGNPGAALLRWVVRRPGGRNQEATGIQRLAPSPEVRIIETALGTRAQPE